ncbi:unnamed protein product [Phytomonas sp. Hart1]|nr:unnamed protein product [Phytomonas sp. Hart1]|eukprot:CCW70564.1 unnamed protein product [Phytomonas sp. isolate Hart1]
MLKRRLSVLLAKGERGLYFPINHRIVDMRIDASVVEEADVQSRYRRELRTSFTTGETRQTATPEWSRRIPPTHFIALRLPPQNVITGRVEAMMNAILFTHSHMESLFIPIPRLHVTLGVMSIAEEHQEDILKATSELLQEACRSVAGKPLRLRFRGLGTFSQGRVLFVRCITEGNFTTLDTLVRRIRKDLGVGLRIDMKGNPFDTYVPHLTVAKIKPGHVQEFGNKIPITVWSNYQHHDFGDVTFDSLDLCSMFGYAKDGYYKVVSSSNLVSRTSASV